MSLRYTLRRSSRISWALTSFTRYGRRMATYCCACVVGKRGGAGQLGESAGGHLTSGALSGGDTCQRVGGAQGEVLVVLKQCEGLKAQSPTLPSGKPSKCQDSRQSIYYQQRATNKPAIDPAGTPTMRRGKLSKCQDSRPQSQNNRHCVRTTHCLEPETHPPSAAGSPPSARTADSPPPATLPNASRKPSLFHQNTHCLKQTPTLRSGKPSECQDSRQSTTGHSSTGLFRMVSSPNTMIWVEGG